MLQITDLPAHLRAHDRPHQNAGQLFKMPIVYFDFICDWVPVFSAQPKTMLKQPPGLRQVLHPHLHIQTPYASLPIDVDSCCKLLRFSTTARHVAKRDGQ